MRFIGSKARLLTQINEFLTPKLDGTEQSFTDLFSGSGVVSQYFKDRFKITSNDLMYFSYVIARATVQLNHVPTYAKLAQAGIADPFKYLQSKDLTGDHGGYVTDNFSPAGAAGRMYFQTKNAIRIDFVREQIEQWFDAGLIDDDGYYYLLDALIQGIPFVSNITGTYGAYLKRWDKRSYKPLALIPSSVVDNESANSALQEDALQLIRHSSGDIVYIDPPYNARQYAPNYHVLETIARWDKPVLHGVTGQRDYQDEKSTFAMKSKVTAAMQDLFGHLNFKHVVVSYSTDGLIPEAGLHQLLADNAVNGEVAVKRMTYRKYKSKIVNPKTQVEELLFYFRSKHYVNPTGTGQPDKKVVASQPVSRGGYIKSPLNYIGGKYKLLPQIIPIFPNHVDTFVDLFSGGGNVGINADAQHVVFNDINTKINGLFRYFQGKDPDCLIAEIRARIAKYQLSKTNQAGFLQYRKDYNADPHPIDLYTLVAYSFNYQFRFNNELQYNNPFGRNRSHFSERMAENLRRFVNRLNTIDATFTDQYFNQIDLTGLGPDSFVYADPPYLITTGSYNDGNRGFVNWTQEQDKQLFTFLDGLDQRQINFALSNVTEHKGRTNDALIAWSQKYHTHYLSYDYSNSSHNTKHQGSCEVLITNY